MLLRLFAPAYRATGHEAEMILIGSESHQPIADDVAEFVRSGFQIVRSSVGDHSYSWSSLNPLPRGAQNRDDIVLFGIKSTGALSGPCPLRFIILRGLT